MSESSQNQSLYKLLKIGLVRDINETIKNLTFTLNLGIGVFICYMLFSFVMHIMGI